MYYDVLIYVTFHVLCWYSYLLLLFVFCYLSHSILSLVFSGTPGSFHVLCWYSYILLYYYLFFAICHIQFYLQYFPGHLVLFVEYHNMGALEVFWLLIRCLVTTVLTHNVCGDPYVVEQTCHGMSHEGLSTLTP